MGNGNIPLRNANGNPWYLLATVHGEQTTPKGTWDEALAERNRGAWNRWLAGDLGEAERKDFAEELRTLFDQRGADPSVSRDKFPPDPTGVPDFSGTNIDLPVTFRGFQFPRGADFRQSQA